MVAIYYNNARSRELKQIDEPRDGCWVHVEGADQSEIAELAAKLELDESLLSDALDPYESPRIEREDGVVYVYTRFCDTSPSSINTVPMLLVYGSSFLLTLTPEQFPNLRNFTEQRIEFLTTQKTKLLLMLLLEFNTSYRRQLNRLSRTILRVRSQLNKASINNKDFVDMIDIEEDLNEILAALVPQNVVMRSLLSGKFIKLFEEDKDLVEDISLGISETVELTNSRLKNIRGIREAYSTSTANNLNRVFKLMTSITILMGIFTLITGIYSMNIKLPAAQNPQAFWIILGAITILVGWAAWLFKRNKWF